MVPCSFQCTLLHLAEDTDNCIEISTSAQIIAKIVSFTTYKRDRNITAVEKLEITTSLMLVRKLASQTDEVGKILRQKITQQRILFRNLLEVVCDSNRDEWKNEALQIISKLAQDEERSAEIGGIFIPKLLSIFLYREQACIIAGEVSWL